MGEWSSAGSILTLSCGAPWFAALPKEAWPDVQVRRLLLLHLRLKNNCIDSVTHIAICHHQPACPHATEWAAAVSVWPILY